ncbi:fibronectin type III domain-containing protein [Kribbella sp. NPDC048915]|uniref:fibronectin type III domain-containing protein n=1 Tax=Kribbella sp. NPDC048915 TaxID=3155148 RepID=UPI0033E0C1FF
MKPSSFRPRRLREMLRGRGRSEATLAAVVAGCVALMSVVVLTGAGSPDNGVKFTQSGHWVYNSVVGRIFHLDGSTGEVDADVELKAEPGSQVVQTDKQGYVLSTSRIDQFGKSDLTVLDPIDPPVTNEQPVGLEGPGAAYAVYRKAGRVIRFGDQQTVASTGGPLGDPVVTSDGTLWVHSTSDGKLCRLPLTTDRMTCPASAPKGHKGGLSAVGTNAVFVDLTANEVYRLNNGGIDNRARLGDEDIPDDALVAGNDVAGRVAIVDREHSQVHLIDVSHPDKPAAPRKAPIPKGTYDKVASSGDGLAILDRKNSNLLTLDRDGRQVKATKIPHRSTDGPSEGRERPESNLYRGGDSRVYVENGTGDRVVVVDRDGRTSPVDVGPGKDGPGKDGDKRTPKPTVTPPVTPPKTNTPNPPRSTPRTTPPNPPRTTPPTQRETPRPPTRKTPDRPGTERTPDRTEPERTRTTPPPPKRTTPPTKPTKPTVTAGRPGAPLNVAARIVDGSGVVTWGAAAAHGATITAYRITWSGGTKSVSGSARSAVFPNLKTKTAYTFTVTAVNSVGTGPAVKSNQVVDKWAQAQSPRELLVQDDGISGRLTLGWMAPTMGDGTFVRYEVSMGSSTAPARVTSTTTKATITGLTDGTNYTFYARAITRAPDGQLVVGKYASLTATSISQEAPTTRIVASRGNGTTYGDKCQQPECAFVQVRIENLQPNTKYSIKPFTSEWGNFNPGYSKETNSEGQLLVPDQFPCSAVGQLVWATVTGPGGDVHTSNKFFWKAAD